MQHQIATIKHEYIHHLGNFNIVFVFLRNHDGALLPLLLSLSHGVEHFFMHLHIINAKAVIQWLRNVGTGMWQP